MDRHSVQRREVNRIIQNKYRKLMNSHEAFLQMDDAEREKLTKLRSTPSHRTSVFFQILAEQRNDFETVVSVMRAKHFRILHASVDVMNPIREKSTGRIYYKAVLSFEENDFNACWTFSKLWEAKTNNYKLNQL